MERSGGGVFHYCVLDFLFWHVSVVSKVINLPLVGERTVWASDGRESSKSASFARILHPLIAAVVVVVGC